MQTHPTADQFGERLEILPSVLRTALFSVETANLGEKVCAENGVKEATPLVADVVAWVLSGFVHSSGAAGAIQEHAGITAEKSKSVASGLNEKIFSKYAMDLEKIYTPMSAGVPRAPAKIMDMGAAPVPPSTPVPAARFPPKPAPPPSSTPAPIKPPAVATPAPFIMHQESSSKPLAAGSGFKLNVPLDMFKSPQVKKVDIPRPPIKAAELEIGKAPTPPKAVGSVSFRAAPDSQSRVVHYTDLRTSLAPGSGFGTLPPAAKTPAAPQPLPQPLPRPQSAPTSPSINRMDSRPSTMPASVLPRAPIMPPKPPATPMPPVIKKLNVPPAPKVVNFGPEEVK